ncbi:MAG: L-histidine N(alpha)-methyltransferase [Bacteroidetes bacterium]|nr:L-histidine N(alpha)-methyltransferase [Bacteroidota bacterium]
MHTAPPTPIAASDPLLQDVLNGLSATPKTLPSKYFYDETGSALFDRITELDAYYPTRTERGIMRTHIREMAEAVGSDSVLIEYGSGSSEKTRLLLDALPNLTAYIPIDISAEHLEATTDRLRMAYPNLVILPVATDYTRPFVIPDDPVRRRKRVVYFPGSTIGNFTPEEARQFLAQISGVIGMGGGLLLGIDRKKDRDVLERAYNDPEGVTAAFNMNLLKRLNRELGADFDLDAFSHEAVYNAERSRVEMHLVSSREQTVYIDGAVFTIHAGESIHTENSYKFDVSDAVGLAASADLELVHEWTDANEWFSVLYFACTKKQ